MPRGTLVVDPKVLLDHFMRQQRGGNITGYRGVRMQRGYGIGGIFKSLARYAIPLFKKGAEAVGKRALQAATQVGQDVLEGKNVSKSIKHRGEEGVKDIIHKGAKSVLPQSGFGKRKRRSPSKPLISAKKQKICVHFKRHPFNNRRVNQVTDEESNHEDDSDSEYSESSSDA